MFDFDGTLSLIREGWQGVMIPMMVAVIREAPGAEDEPTIHAVVKDYVTRLTGRRTIYQMIRLTEEIEKCGGHPLESLAHNWPVIACRQSGENYCSHQAACGSVRRLYCAMIG